MFQPKATEQKPTNPELKPLTFLLSIWGPTLCYRGESSGRSVGLLLRSGF